MKPLAQLFFSPHGRIGRGRFLVSVLFVSLVFVVLFVFLETMIRRAATWALYPLFFWAIFSLTAKRLHDRAASSVWLLMALVPFLGPLWLAITLFMRPGLPGENQYGADPEDDIPDFLAVDIHQPGPSERQ